MLKRASLDELPADLRERLDRRGFDPDQLVRWSTRVGQGDEQNRLTGEVSRVDDAEVKRVPDDPAEAERLRERGAQALAAGELAICVLAGGMATRMGGVVKSLLPVVGEHTFLDYRLAERAQLGERHGKAPPFWLMTSESTDAPIAAAVAARADADGIATFEQLVSLRLDEAGALFRDDEGEPSVYATGHGDLPDALRRAGLLQAFVAAGGRHVWISNVDNLGASVDLAILGQHIEEGRSLTVELVDKVAGDKGGGPVRHQGQPIIAEHFRLPRDFDADAIPIFNTNTFLVDARALLELTLEWTYVEVVKQVGERRAVQFERLLGEITIAIRPTFNWVPRDGEGSRFLPVKSYEDLEHHRPALERIGRRLGLLRPSSG